MNFFWRLFSEKRILMWTNGIQKYKKEKPNAGNGKKPRGELVETQLFDYEL